MTTASIIGVPMDLGASRRGVDMGPSGFRIAKLGERLEQLGVKVHDLGNLDVKVRESITEENSKAKYVEEIAEVVTELRDAVLASLEKGTVPVVLGGDHSIAIGTVAGASWFFRKKKQELGLLWFDAHADINTPATTISGNVHGMPVAHILGLGHEGLLKIADHLPLVNPKHVAMVGLRDIDPLEKKTLKDAGIRVFTMREIDERGLRTVMLEALQIVNQASAGFHVSFDLDWIDPSVAPGVGTPVPGGATYREAHLAMEMVADSKRMVSLEVTEVNPILDTKNQTAALGTEMILSAFGKTIL